MTLGQYLNNYLNEHDMSIRAFASAAGISHTYITYIVNGKTSRGRKPTLTLDIYKKIAAAIGIETNELLSMVDDDVEWGTPKGDVAELRALMKDNYAFRILFNTAKGATEADLLEAAAQIQRRKEERNE